MWLLSWEPIKFQCEWKLTLKLHNREWCHLFTDMKTATCVGARDEQAWE